MATNKIQTTHLARQGDVLIMRMTDAVKVDVEPMPADHRGIVLAEGETSGHFHAVIGRGGAARLFRYRDGRSDRLLEVGTGGADVRVIGGGAGGVDRHTPISITPGKYIVRIQRSWDSSRARRVED